MQEVFRDELEPGTRLVVESRIAQRIRITCAGRGTVVEFSLVAGQSFTVVAGAESIRIDTFNPDEDGAAGLRLVPNDGGPVVED